MKIPLLAEQADRIRGAHQSGGAANHQYHLEAYIFESLWDEEIPSEEERERKIEANHEFMIPRSSIIGKSPEVR